MSAHTPGPWEVRFPLNYTGRAAVFWRDTSKSGVHSRRLDDRGAFDAADARLIAAAPELLEALGTLAAFPLESFNYANDPDSKEIFGANGEWTLTVGVIRKARAAIAKATGEAQ